MKKMLMILGFVFLSVTAHSQTQVNPIVACDVVASGTTFVVTSGGRPTVLWLMDAQVPANPPNDMTLVNQRINGFYVQLNNLTRIETGTLTPTVCPSGNANAGKLAYAYQYPSNVPAGKHTISVRAWNFVLNPDSTPTTTRQEGSLVSVPFTAADVFHVGPPNSPVNISIVR